MQRILIVDDEPEYCAELTVFLQSHGFQVSAIQDSRLVEERLRSFDPHLVVLDQFLGNDTASKLLAASRLNGVPCIVVTGRSDPLERILHLELGADDEISKTESPRELLARIHSVLRRTHGRPVAAAQPAPSTAWRFLADRRELIRPDGTPCHLTSAEFETLRALIAANGEPVGRAELCRLALRRDLPAGDRAVDTLIRKLREKIDPIRGENVIKSVRHLGYVFVGFPETEAG